MLNIKSPKSGRLIFIAINLGFLQHSEKVSTSSPECRGAPARVVEAAVITRGRIYFSPDSDCSSLIREIYLLTPPSYQTLQIF